MSWSERARRALQENGGDSVRTLEREKNYSPRGLSHSGAPTLLFVKNPKKAISEGDKDQRKRTLARVQQV